MARRALVSGSNIQSVKRAAALLSLAAVLIWFSGCAQFLSDYSVSPVPQGGISSSGPSY